MKYYITFEVGGIWHTCRYNPPELHLATYHAMMLRVHNHTYKFGFEL